MDLDNIFDNHAVKYSRLLLIGAAPAFQRLENLFIALVAGDDGQVEAESVFCQH